MPDPTQSLLDTFHAFRDGFAAQVEHNAAVLGRLDRLDARAIALEFALGVYMRNAAPEARQEVLASIQATIDANAGDASELGQRMTAAFANLHRELLEV